MASRHRTAALAVGLVLALFAGALALAHLAPTAPPRGVTTGDSLFETTRIWTIELRFTPAQWKALEPTGGDGPPGGPGGPGGGPPGPPDGGPGTLVSSVVVRRGDTDGNGSLSRTEFTSLARTLFDQLDSSRTGVVDEATLRRGLESVVRPPGGEGPGGRGGPGAPPDGGPGGRGGPGGGMQARDGNRNGMAGATGLDFPTVKADLVFDGQPYPSVSVRYKGNNTFMEARNSIKRSFKVDLNDDGYDGRKIGGASKLNLHNNVTDAGWMNEVLSYRLFRDAGVPAARTAYVRLYVTVPGQYDRKYFGLYSLVENIDTNFARDRFGTKKGALFKPVTNRLFEDVGGTWAAYAQAYDAKTPVSDEETQRVIDFAKLVTHATDAEFEARIEEFLGLDEFARFMAVTVWLSNMDSILGMGQNFYVYLHPKTRQFQVLPWDLDHSFGQFMGGSTTLGILKASSGVRFLERVFQVTRFRRLYLARMKEFSGSICAPERIHHQVDELAAVLRLAVEDESADALARFDAIVAGKTPAPSLSEGRAGPGPGGVPPREAGPGWGRDGAAPPNGGGPGGPPPGMGGGMASIKAFVTARAQSVRDQLAGRSDGTSGGRGGPGPGGPGLVGEPGGRGAGPDEGKGGPAAFLARLLIDSLDADHDGRAARAEVEAAVALWFDLWDTDFDERLSPRELAAGINQDLMHVTRTNRP